MRTRRVVGLALLFITLVRVGSLLAPAAAESSPERVVVLVPLGPVRQDFLDTVRQKLQSRMKVRIRIEPARALPQEAWYAPRRRWRADRILAAHPDPELTSETAPTPYRSRRFQATGGTRASSAGGPSQVMGDVAVQLPNAYTPYGVRV